MIHAFSKMLYIYVIAIRHEFSDKISEEFKEMTALKITFH